MNVASALYNFDMSLLLKGIGTTTLPTALFDYLRWDCGPTGAAVGSISIVVTLLTILPIDRNEAPEVIAVIVQQHCVVCPVVPDRLAHAGLSLQT
ncbi:hypothetical protein D8B34_03870 [Verminephrobacter eiseniae]|uniref:hypothetical protein n=1 Tax=Verminephrobacter eiseniae TaxID=364317 RepID=UPI002237D0CB|nr:hypothetical protein [Verminephrobacter eiseniae]MCW5232091.1 hypothetical protein [Verminephrobacter eiseniae]MCW5296347.1 hypothetical protein [Verminephrobacter eiseniae]MCW8184040.1 hypothetical protein [Verminephrobacter eiseniae]MCW8222641.1 hypothetical protein [Verminephrobacter eiseniae]MCW8232960.1 hypothetical protein [Verminephrobacter eiseniae]